MGKCAQLPHVLICLAFFASTTGCLRKTEFRCDDDTDCSTGFCEATNYCSFTDSTCGGGRRYGELSGSYSGQCVDATGDAGVTDSTPDDGSAGCPGSYATISGGGAHVYRRLDAAVWTTQRDACAADGANAYLAIPDDMAELTAITTLGATTVTWVGIHDRNTENMFETVRGDTPPFLPWATGEPNDGPGGQDCVVAVMASGQIRTERCSDSYVAVCECEP